MAPTSVLLASKARLAAVVFLLVFCSGLSSHPDDFVRSCHRKVFYYNTLHESWFPGAEFLRIVGYVGGHVFTYAPDHMGKKLDTIRLPVDLAKLFFVNSQDPDFHAIPVSFANELDFSHVVRLHQDQDGRLVILKYGKRDISLTNNEISIGKAQSTKLLYNVVDRTTLWMEILKVPHREGKPITTAGDIHVSFPLDDLDSFVFNKTVFVNGTALKELKDGLKMTSSKWHPCIDVKHPVAEVHPPSSPLCHKRSLSNGHEVIASYRSLLTTKTRCHPKLNLTTAFNGRITVNVSGIPTEILFDEAELDCYYIRAHSTNESCLLAYGPSQLFQSVQLSPTMPVTTPVPPFSYRHRALTDEGCMITNEEIAENFEIFEWYGGCLFRLPKLPYYHDFPEGYDSAGCNELNDQYFVRRAVFMQSPYHERSLVMFAEYGPGNELPNGTMTFAHNIGAAYMPIPTAKTPSKVPFMLTKPIDKEENDWFRIPNLYGVDLALTRKPDDADHVYVLKEGLVWDQLKLFPWIIAGEEVCRIQNFYVPPVYRSYSNKDIDAVRRLRKRFAYLDTDPIKKPYSVVGTWAVRYADPKLAETASNYLMLIKEPKCTPVVYHLYGRKVFVAPRMPPFNIRSPLNWEEMERQRAEAQTVRPLVMFGMFVCTAVPILVTTYLLYLWMRRQKRRAEEGYVNHAREAEEDCCCAVLCDL